MDLDSMKPWKSVLLAETNVAHVMEKAGAVHVKMDTIHQFWKVRNSLFVFLVPPTVLNAMKTVHAKNVQLATSPLG